MSQFDGVGDIATVLGVIVAILVAIILVLKIRAKHKVIALAGLLVAATIAMVVGDLALKEPSTGPMEAPWVGNDVRKVDGTDDRGGSDGAYLTVRAVKTVEDKREEQVLLEPAVPINFTLNNGEQRVVLGGQASVAVQFSRVGSIDLATLKLFGDEGSQTQPMLSGGKRFEIKAGAKQYFVTVINLDFQTRQAKLQLDRNVD